MPLAQNPKLRFAVGTFDSWAQVGNALHDLSDRGLVLDSFNCLALERVFAGKTVLAPDQQSVAVQALPFTHNSEPIACTSGPLARSLADRLSAGAQSLKDALGYWLIPRHAAHLQDAVQSGKILFWIRVTDPEDEQRACRTLLSHSSNSVGAHDFMPPGKP
jgi:hypothetical protein